ncbi:MAG: gfo/Idh/MocA family oxidoreductase [Planctomycetes bacterium]|nr:gfo/Idh/MocA family oxidoreductase [Planctomycetota bacterium]MCG2684327.1 gfo/Idh/MocA family oxidoreductase [Planctomycetales bacterium]
MGRRLTSLQSSTSRRGFLKTSGTALAGTTVLSAIAARAHAAEKNTIKLALIGCGGRGAGAALNALSTKGPTVLWAMADVFEDRLRSSLKSLAKHSAESVDVPEDRRYVGMDAYRKAIDSLDPGSVVLLATPPAFRPIHLEYAVQKRMHVFMEKSFAVDAPGIRRVLKAGEEATKKNLKIVGGLMSRHYGPLEEAVRQIHDGAIGEVITCWAYREHAPVGFTPKSPGASELAHQIRNYSNFTWLNGSFLLDWLIHNIDVCCWVKDAWPVSAQGQGGRQVRKEPDQLFDHYAVEYTFADGTRLMAQGRHLAGCWGFFGDVIHGAKGSAILGEGQPQPRIYKSHVQTPESLIWQHKGPRRSPYQVEHDRLFEAIRQDKPYNETERCAKAAMAGILGRMAAESGKLVTWDEALASNLELSPGLDHYTMESDPPVMPDPQGRYPIAMPGETKVL